jgi:hypothetical protein
MEETGVPRENHRPVGHLSHLFSKTNKCHCDWIWIKRSSSLAFHAYRVCNYFEQILHSSRTTNRDPHKEPPSIFVLTSACGLVIRSNHQTFQTINFTKNYPHLISVKTKTMSNTHPPKTIHLLYQYVTCDTTKIHVIDKIYGLKRLMIRSDYQSTCTGQNKDTGWFFVWIHIVLVHPF